MDTQDDARDLHDDRPTCGREADDRGTTRAQGLPLGRAVLLALKRPLGHQLDGVHLRPPYLDTGEGHAHALDADRPLDDVQPRAGIHQPLHESEVAG